MIEFHPVYLHEMSEKLPDVYESIKEAAISVHAKMETIGATTMDDITTIFCIEDTWLQRFPTHVASELFHQNRGYLSSPPKLGFYA